MKLRKQRPVGNSWRSVKHICHLSCLNIQYIDVFFADRLVHCHPDVCDNPDPVRPFIIYGQHGV